MKILKDMGELTKKITLKFEGLAMEWLEYKKNTVKESTYYNYMFIINKYLRPDLENMNLRKLEKVDYNNMIQEMSKRLAPKTVRDISNVLKAILKYANQVYKCNINLEKIIVPRVEWAHLKILSKKEKMRLEKRCLKEDDLRTIGIIVCLYTGMRIGEICALKWKDIDLDARLIYVRKTLQRIYTGANGKSKILIGKPKTRSSNRAIPITSKLYELLVPLRKKFDSEDYFLTGSSERFLEPRNYQYTYKKVLRRSRVREYKFHILRHTFASECVEVGMDPKSLSEVLGHANVNITLNRYVHSSVKMKKKFLEKL